MRDPYSDPACPVELPGPRPIVLVVLLLVLAASLIHAWREPRPAANELPLSLGEWALRAGHPARAAGFFEQFIAKQHGSANSLALVGSLLADSNRWTEAVPYLQRAVAANPAHPACLLLGMAYEKLGRDPEALSTYQEALRRRPKDPETLNALGYYYAQRAQHLDEAVRVLREAVALRPDDGNIGDSLGWALYQRGEVIAAVRRLRIAAQLTPAAAEIRYHLGIALARAGERQAAQVELAKALQLRPGFAPAQQILDRVRRQELPPIPVPLVTEAADAGGSRPR